MMLYVLGDRADTKATPPSPGWQPGRTPTCGSPL